MTGLIVRKLGQEHVRWSESSERAWDGLTTAGMGRMAHGAWLRVAILSVGLTVVGVVSALAGRSEPGWSGKVVGVSDGDTIKVMRDGRAVKVRLHGVDTPETGQPFGKAAKRVTSLLVYGKVVRVVPVDRDRYGRVVARVALGRGKWLDHALLRAGVAWHYRRYSKDPVLARLEREARQVRRGLWADASPQAPWAWREQRRERGKTPGSVRGPSTAKPRPGAAHQAQGDPRTQAAPIQGNTSSKRFHRRGCPGYGCKHCTRTFQSAKEARRAGFTPCGTCFRASAGQGSAPRPPAASPAAPPDGPLHGNTNSKKYHRPACPAYRCKHCTRRFTDEATARAAGYAPCGRCGHR